MGVGYINLLFLFCCVYPSFILSHPFWCAIAIPDATQKYLDSLTTLDYAFSIIIGLANLTGAVSLFFFRRVAYSLFLGSLIANIFMSVWHALTKDLLTAFVSGGAIGIIIGWGMLLAVCIYAKNLSKTGVLR